jgi:hypothetical protein
MAIMGKIESSPGVTRTPDLLIRSQTLYPDKGFSSGPKGMPKKEFFGPLGDLNSDPQLFMNAHRLLPP